MSDRYYSVDLKYTGSQVPVPAQTGIRDQRTANAIKQLYPKRLSPTVGEDTVSISALSRAIALGANGVEPLTGEGAAAEKAVNSDAANPRAAEARTAPPPETSSTSSWIA